jgi:hypothetical protein
MFIFVLLVFKVHQHLDFVSTSFAFRRLELVVVIVAKLTIVGATVAGMMLLARTLLEQALLEQPCWSVGTFFF